jgi:hypothetical protein
MRTVVKNKWQELWSRKGKGRHLYKSCGTGREREDTCIRVVEQEGKGKTPV